MGYNNWQPPKGQDRGKGKQLWQDPNGGKGTYWNDNGSKGGHWNNTATKGCGKGHNSKGQHSGSTASGNTGSSKETLPQTISGITDNPEGHRKQISDMARIIESSKRIQKAIKDSDILKQYAPEGMTDAEVANLVICEARVFSALCEHGNKRLLGSNSTWSVTISYHVESCST